MEDYNFRNQPHCTYLDRTFEGLNDVLYSDLESLDRQYFAINRLNDNIFEPALFVDPRTNLVCPEQFVDHRASRKSKIFKSEKKSLLSVEEHILGLKFLQPYLSQRTSSQVKKYKSVKIKWDEEQKTVDNFIKNFDKEHRVRILKPTEPLLDLYSVYYKCYGKKFKEIERNEGYNTCMAFNNVKVAISAENQIKDMIVTKLNWKGHILNWHPPADCFKMNTKWEIFSELYNENIFGKMDNFEVGHQFEEITNLGDGDLKFFIPIETLSFLLTAGDYRDLPTKVLLEIENNENVKFVKFKKPLPSFEKGFHTNNLTFQQMYTAYLSKCENQNWFQIVDNECKLMPKYEPKDIDGNAKIPKEYKIFAFEDYLEKYKVNNKIPENPLKMGTALVKWKLKQADMRIIIYSSLELPPAQIIDSQAVLFRSFSIRLEYRPEFGCEVMTKYELIRNWLQLTLMDSAKTTDFGKCLRISANSFEIQAEENYTIQAIENELLTHYNVAMPVLLSGLIEFLKRLSSEAPNGKYLLHYNEKFKDQFLLCAPSNEKTRATIFLHDLFNDEQTNGEFLIHEKMQPISARLCSIVHLEHKFLPKTFLPRKDVNGKKEKNQILHTTIKNNQSENDNKNSDQIASKSNRRKK